MTNSLRAVPVLLASLALSACCVYFIKPRRHSFTQPECKSNLKHLFSAQKDACVTEARKIDFSIERGNRYAYFLTGTGFMQLRNTEVVTEPPAEVAVVKFGIDSVKHHGFTNADAQAGIPLALFQQLSVHGECPRCEFTAA